MSKNCSLSVVLSLVMFAANAQFRKIPAAVTDSFKTRYENASGVSWKDKLTSFQAAFKQEDKEMKATFSSAGEWQKTEIEYSFESLPADVKDGFKKSKFADLDVVDVLQVEEKEKGTQYKIVVKRNDIAKRSLVFSEAGQLISDSALF